MNTAAIAGAAAAACPPPAPAAAAPGGSDAQQTISALEADGNRQGVVTGQVYYVDVP